MKTELLHEKSIAYYHLPGLFEFFEFYRAFLPLYRQHRDWFYDWCEIGSIYGAPMDCLWGGGRVENGETDPKEVAALLKAYGISARLTFSNSLLEAKDLSDKKCNRLCEEFSSYGKEQNGVILTSDLLLDYLGKNYPDLYFISSTTKVLTDFDDFERELDRPEFSYVVPDFRLNKKFEELAELSPTQKEKTEFLCNECCSVGCKDRRACYESVSRKSLGIEDGFFCSAPGLEEGYRFSQAMKNPAFIGIDEIRQTYLPMGFSNFKIEGRGLGSAILLEFLLYYMTLPQRQLQVREALYLDNMLDLF